jgi:hypothetical protein
MGFWHECGSDDAPKEAGLNLPCFARPVAPGVIPPELATLAPQTSSLFPG